MRPAGLSPTTSIDERYEDWQSSTVPRLGENLFQHMDNMVGLVANLASGVHVTHDECYNVVQFLGTLQTDSGQLPPNIRALIEYIDFVTKDDGTEPADSACRLPSPP